jgi:signal transduction histidine kinase
VILAFRQAPEVDVALALAVFVGLLVNGALIRNGADLGVGAVVLAAATSLALVVRRRYPVGSLTIVSAGLLACLAVFHPNFAAVGAVMLAVYTVGLQGQRLRSLLVGALMAPVVAAAVVITSKSGFETGPAVARLALLLAALAAGDARRGRLALMQAAAEEDRREREAATRHRFDEERLRLAHELHDTIAHTLVAINVRAAAAGHLQHSREEGSAALEEIKRSSAGALAELRSSLKILRPAGDEAPMRPAQSLADLQELVDGVAGAGVEFELQIGTIPRELPAAIGHATYRIVQESLTNVLRHSHAGHAVVTVSVARDTLTVEIRDDGNTAASAAAPGHGLRGMAERATALGGHCEADIAPGGGWRVRASLPARAAGA